MQNTLTRWAPRAVGTALTIFPGLFALAACLASTAYAQDGDVRRRLESPEVIDRVSCAATGRAYAELFPSGALKSCPVARDTVIQRQRIPAGTWIGLTDLRALDFAWLLHDAELSGHLCKGVGYKGFSVRFHEDGSLRLCFIPEDAMIDGVPCIHGSFWTELRGGGKSAVTFHRDGSLAGCQLSRDTSFDGVQFSKWTRVSRMTTGRISRATSTGP